MGEVAEGARKASGQGVLPVSQEVASPQLCLGHGQLSGDDGRAAFCRRDCPRIKDVAGARLVSSGRVE